MFKPNHRSYLKVKIKSLAAESRIIRHEEKKAYDNDNREGLYLHRVKDVRRESRASQLAYAFLRGVPFLVVEPSSNDTYEREQALRRAESIARKFGTDKGFNAWVQEASVEQ